MTTHQNKAEVSALHFQWSAGEISGEEAYPIDRCYWNYLRVYKEEGVKLLDATHTAQPGKKWRWAGTIPAQVDELEEELPGDTRLRDPAGGARGAILEHQFPLCPAPHGPGLPERRAS